MDLTTRQKARLSKLQGAQKAAQQEAYERQNSGKQGKRAKEKQPKQQLPKPQPIPKVKVQPAMTWAFDGFDKRHLPVDETTAPYATTNFLGTMEFGSSHDIDQVIVVCPRSTGNQESHVGPLTDFIAMRYDAHENVSANVPTLDTLRSPVIGAPDRDATVHQHYSVRGRLHNMSVRLTCTGTNEGLVPPGSAYVGAVPMIETGSFSMPSKDALSIKRAWAEDNIAVGYIRPVSAASLQAKSVVIHSAVAENVAYKSWNDFIVPPITTNLGALPMRTTLEPIVIYIPKCGNTSTVVNYRLEVGQQWCTRHPFDIMMRSTQKQHMPTDSNTWQSAICSVKDVGEHLLARGAGMAADAAVARITQAIAGGHVPAP